MDANALAEQLGVTAKTVRTRARALGIKGTQAKSGESHRPGTVYNAEECERIANYGQRQKPVTDGNLGTEDEAISQSALALQQAIGSPLAAQFQAIATQLDTLEEDAANALAARVSAVPHRVLSRTAAKLQGFQPVEMAEVFGVLSAPQLPSRPLSFDALAECL